jgi:succinate-semialdehyde dehydrogenase/glutarate-semialdehyde dehydrogenase
MCYPAGGGQDPADAAVSGRRGLWLTRLVSLPPSVSPARLGQLARRLVTSPRAATHTPVAAFTGEPLPAYPLSTAADVDLAFATARAAQAAWQRRSVGDRARLMLRLHDVVIDRRDDVMDVIQLETGKARIHAFEEVVDTALNSRYYARTAARALRPTRRAGFVPVITVAEEHRHPKGVVGLIAPWNFPVVLALCDAIPALIAGNAVVLKPDEKTVYSALLGAELLSQAGLPEGLFQVVAGPGPVLGPEVVDRADFVGFTGSTATGRLVAQQAASRLVGSSLELGGKNASIVMADADLTRAVEGTVHGAFSSAGQLCVSAERLYVADDVYVDFVGRLVRRIEGMALSADFDFTAEMGSLTSQSQLDRVAAHVDDAVARGARVLTGGHPIPQLGPYFYAPTLLEGVTPDMIVCDQETFGPVVSVYPFRGAEEAVRLANDSAFGLNASIWSRDIAGARRLAARIQAGTVNVNEGYGAAWGSIDAPMGGMKDSGLGRRHGAEGLTKYTEPQTVATARFTNYAVPPFVPQRRYVDGVSLGLRLLKALGRR